MVNYGSSMLSSDSQKSSHTSKDDDKEKEQLYHHQLTGQLSIPDNQALDELLNHPSSLNMENYKNDLESKQFIQDQRSLQNQKILHPNTSIPTQNDKDLDCSNISLIEKLKQLIPNCQKRKKQLAKQQSKKEEWNSFLSQQNNKLTKIQVEKDRKGRVWYQNQLTQKISEKFSEIKNKFSKSQDNIQNDNKNIMPRRPNFGQQSMLNLIPSPHIFKSQLITNNLSYQKTYQEDNYLPDFFKQQPDLSGQQESNFSDSFSMKNQVMIINRILDDDITRDFKLQQSHNSSIGNQPNNQLINPQIQTIIKDKQHVDSFELQTQKGYKKPEPYLDYQQTKYAEQFTNFNQKYFDKNLKMVSQKTNDTLIFDNFDNHKQQPVGKINNNKPNNTPYKNQFNKNQNKQERTGGRSKSLNRNPQQNINLNKNQKQSQQYQIKNTCCTNDCQVRKSVEQLQLKIQELKQQIQELKNRESNPNQFKNANQLYTQSIIVRILSNDQTVIYTFYGIDCQAQYYIIQQLKDGKLIRDSYKQSKFYQQLLDAASNINKDANLKQNAIHKDCSERTYSIPLKLAQRISKLVNNMQLFQNAIEIQIWNDQTPILMPKDEQILHDKYSGNIIHGKYKGTVPQTGQLWVLNRVEHPEVQNILQTLGYSYEQLLNGIPQETIIVQITYDLQRFYIRIRKGIEAKAPKQSMYKDNDLLKIICTEKRIKANDITQKLTEYYNQVNELLRSNINFSNAYRQVLQIIYDNFSNYKYYLDSNQIDQPFITIDLIAKDSAKEDTKVEFTNNININRLLHNQMNVDIFDIILFIKGMIDSIDERYYQLNQVN